MELRLHPALCHVYLKSHFLAPLSSSCNYTLLYCCVQVFQAEPLIDPSSKAHLSLPLTSALPLSITVTHRAMLSAWDTSPISPPSWAFLVFSSSSDPM